MLKKFNLLSVILVFTIIAMLLSACNNGEKPGVLTSSSEIEFKAGAFDSNLEELKLVIEADEISKLSEFKNLKNLDLTGSTCYKEILELIKSNPDINVVYSVKLPDGTEVSSELSDLSFSSIKAADADALIEVLAYLPKLKTLDLGSGIDVEGSAGIDEISKLCKAYPQITFDYSLSIYGKALKLSDEQVDINHIEVTDDGEAVKKLLSCMPNCKFLDMDSCKVSDEKMAEIRDAFPNVKVVWRVWFGNPYSVRTDVKKILASFHPSGVLKTEDLGSLKYCTDLVYLDIGHNMIDDISFVEYMPNLEVVIIGLNPWTDATPLGKCTKIEYLEIFKSRTTDISALANLKDLKHLNICYMPGLTDISPLYGLNGLERLWIGKDTPIPAEQVEKIKELFPDCIINTITPGPTDMGWRNHPRYDLLREQFQYSKEQYSYYWLDEKYYPAPSPKN
ncbi:MAG: hypothetical protein GX684_00825 [Ruminococcaceae bacterium]|nr:hypothetical protein [Oscillospiraceae bacterium]